MTLSVSQLRGRRAFELVAIAGLPMTLAQMVVLKTIEGGPLDARERRMARRLTGANMLAPPKPGGYSEAYLRCGRRSGKSTRIAAPLAVAALLADVDHVLAPGEGARVLLVAPRRDQTRTLLDACSGLLDLLGVAHEKLNSLIRVQGLRVSIETSTADEVAGRSASAVLVVVDEAALLPYESGAAGNDRELVAALKPTLSTTGGRFVMLSTPWGQEGVHFEKTEQLWGQLSGRGVAFRAPTWLLNSAKFPDEASTRAFEEDEKIWSREWAAIPGHHDSAAFSPDDLESGRDKGVRQRDPVPGIAYACGYDEGGRHSARACVITHDELRSTPAGSHARFTIVDFAKRWEPGRGTDHDEVMKQVAAIAGRYNNAVVQRDLFSGDAVQSALRRHATASTEVSMAPQQQTQRFRDLQVLVETHRLRLLDDERLLKEMRGFRETLHQGGRISFHGSTKGGDDLVDALCLAAAKSAKLVPGGGDIVVVNDRRFIWRPDAGGLEVTQRTYGRRLANGQILPHQPPDGTPEAETARAQRFQEGRYSAQDLEQLGEEELFKRLGGINRRVQ